MNPVVKVLIKAIVSALKGVTSPVQSNKALVNRPLFRGLVHQHFQRRLTRHQNA